MAASRPEARSLRNFPISSGEAIRSAIETRRIASPPDVALVENPGSTRVVGSAHDAAAVGEDREAHVLEVGREELLGPADPRDAGEAGFEGSEVGSLPSGGGHLDRIAPAELDDLGGAFTFERRESTGGARGTERGRARAFEKAPRRETLRPDLETENAA